MRSLHVLGATLVGLFSVMAGLGAPTRSDQGRSQTSFTPPLIRHVFVIMLENKGYSATFGDPSADPYLAKTLVSEGALLTRYYATGHESNDNYVSFISGQAPNPASQADCQYFTPFTDTGTVYPGQAVGNGCVFPSKVPTLANQLASHGFTWKGYMQDMGNDPTRDHGTVCAHPGLGAKDNTQAAVPGDGYATRHNPFVYFESIIGHQAYCDSHVVPLGTTTGALPKGAPAGTTGLATDLKSASTTPNVSFIVPNLCYDGHDYPCKNQPSGSSALADIDAFLKAWVPLITSSPAFKHNGLLEITFDESAGPKSDSSSCCNETPGPNSPRPGIDGPGGGRVGAVLLSPFIKPGTVTTRPYNHYSSLASIEQLFGLAALGMAQTVSTRFGPDVYTNQSG
jgi:hypothetical protein